MGTFAEKIIRLIEKQAKKSNDYPMENRQPQL